MIDDWSLLYYDRTLTAAGNDIYGSMHTEKQYTVGCIHNIWTPTVQRIHSTLGTKTLSLYQCFLVLKPAEELKCSLYVTSPQTGER